MREMREEIGKLKDLPDRVDELEKKLKKRDRCLQELGRVARTQAEKATVLTSGFRPSMPPIANLRQSSGSGMGLRSSEVRRERDHWGVQSHSGRHHGHALVGAISAATQPGQKYGLVILPRDIAPNDPSSTSLANVR